jgi:hypothetical protein
VTQRQPTISLPQSVFLMLGATMLCQCGQSASDAPDAPDKGVGMAHAGTGGSAGYPGTAGSSGASPGGGGLGGAGASGGVVAGAAGLGTGGGQGGTAGETGVSGEGGVGISPDFCPPAPPASSTTCGLNYNDPDAVCVYAEETCSCFSPNLMHAPPLWNCVATSPAD